MQAVPAQPSQPSPEAANALRLAELAAMPPVRTSRVPAPLAVEGWYMVQLQRLVRAATQAMLAELQPILAEQVAEERMDAGDKPVPIRVLRGLDKLKVKARQTAEGFPAAEVVAQAANKVEVFNGTGIGQVAKELGLSVQPLKGAAKLQAARDRFMAENTALIKNIPEDIRERIEQKVRKGVESGKRWETIAKDLQAEQGIGERRARLIARDQVNKYNGALTEARMTKLGITHYRWQGAMDQRERPTHVALQGLVFAWDKPPPEGHPGHPIQCRCVAIPVVSDKEKREAKDMTEEELKARTAAVTEKYGKGKKASKAAPAKKAEPAKATAAKPVKAAPAAKATAAKASTAAPVKATTAAQTQAKPAAAAAQAALVQATPAAAAQAKPAQAKPAAAAPVAQPKVLAVPKGGMGKVGGTVRKIVRKVGETGALAHPVITVPKVITPGIRKNLGDLALPRKHVLDRILKEGGAIELVDGEVIAAKIAQDRIALVPEDAEDIASSAGISIGNKAAVGTMPGESASPALHELGHIHQAVTYFEMPGKLKELADLTRESLAKGWVARLTRRPEKYYELNVLPNGKVDLVTADEEWYAELFALYHRQPGRLRRVSQKLFDFMDRELAQ